MDVVDVWTGRRASALRTALRLTNESFAAHLGAGVRTVANWEAKPETVLSPAMQEVLDSALEQASAAARSRFFMLCKSAENSALSGERSATAGAAMGEATFIDSARESASDAVLRSGRVGDAVESLRAQLISTSARYSHRSPVTVFADARHLRNVAYQLAEHANRPGELADSGVFS